MQWRNLQQRRRFSSGFSILSGIVWFSVMTALLSGIVLFSAPSNFPEGVRVAIEPGTSARDAAGMLAERNIIYSPHLFLAVLRARGERIQAGTYAFPERRTMWGVITTVTRSAPSSEEITVTVPEGMASYQLAELLGRSIPGFDSERFYELARAREGYLFPDTYRWFASVSPEEIVVVMQERFDEQVSELDAVIGASPYTVHELLTLASLLEKEARQYETMRMVMGVLQNRLNVDMPLQVDAVFGYIFETDTFNPSFEDLLVDSPYNTYRYAGLPPGPINNPGLAALRATLDPIEHNHLYYLTGRDGVMYYAQTYTDHLINRRRYLD